MIKVGKILGVSVLFIILIGLCAAFLRPLELYVLVVVLAFYGWVFYAFLHYRYFRQEEVLQLLRGVGEGNAPLAPALRAYVYDRPPEPWREFWVGVLQFFIFPGYYWVWHRRHRFDTKVERVARCLEAGYPLHVALKSSPGVASRETLLAAAVADSTGKLVPSLESAPRWRMATLWLEAAPRLIYPFLVLLAVLFVAVLLAIFIFPKYERIFLDLQAGLPDVTRWFLSVVRFGAKHFALVSAGFLALIVSGATVFFSSTLCWNLPFVRRYYRRYAQGRILTMLSLLLEAGKTCPAALRILADSGYFGTAVRKRIIGARQCIEEGAALAESLHQTGLLPAPMKHLIQAAERAHNLPWALGELGQALGMQLRRGFQRIAQVFFPAGICLAGAMVAFVVFATFFPLLTLMAKLNQ
ncbi:MAG: type II secretion system F family protein [Planctomycetes bacterium]|nr:type II secretion system F family protein [Planctomycetota bacterium]